MSIHDLHPTEEELHAFVDGELPEDRRGAVEAWLAAHPEDAARVRAWRMQTEAIRARYGDAAAEPLPTRLRLDRLRRAEFLRKAAAAAAVILAFVLGGGAGWFAHASRQQAAQDEFAILTSEAVDAYKLYAVEVRHPVEVPGSEADHLAQWLSKRVGYPLRPPNLEPIGLKLVGGRLLPTDTGAAAAFFMYENGAGDRFALYCAKARTGNTALHSGETGKAPTVYWVDNNVAYVVSGAAERKKLWQVARAAYEQLEPANPQKSGS
ncbi:MAG TPA: anti-sigma factor [Xanthobacteraceae bacterium]|nr:anti-sigma factor [Xanthobacteraceae bacterium]